MGVLGSFKRPVTRRLDARFAAGRDVQRLTRQVEVLTATVRDIKADLAEAQRLTKELVDVIDQLWQANVELWQAVEGRADAALVDAAR